MNQLTLIGRLTKDPESRPVGEKIACKFTIAVDREYKDREGNKITDFIPCDAIGQPAEFICNYITKGRLVAIQGAMNVDQYIDSEGNQKSFTKCAVRSVQALDSAKETGNTGAAQATKPTGKGKPAANKPIKPAGKPKMTKPATNA